jgi:segregation and condensation protein A
VIERVEAETTEPAKPDAASSWEDPPRRPATEEAADMAPILSVDGFEGPLDWLLEMARAQKIDLARLSIAALIGAFAAALENALAGQGGRLTQLGRWGDWLVMAATLTHLRSRLLLPADAPGSEAAEDEAEALRRRLVRRAHVHATADWLERQPQLGRDVFGRSGAGRASGESPWNGRGGEDSTTPGRVGDITELLRACLVALQLPEELETYRLRPPPLWRVTDAIAWIERLIGKLPYGGTLGAFLPRISDEPAGRELRCRAAVASTLIAGLELARSGALTLDQEEPWRSIKMEHPAADRRRVTE